jgi:hypothetical protein
MVSIHQGLPICGNHAGILQPAQDLLHSRIPQASRQTALGAGYPCPPERDGPAGKTIAGGSTQTGIQKWFYNIIIMECYFTLL